MLCQERLWVLAFTCQLERAEILAPQTVGRFWIPPLSIQPVSASLLWKSLLFVTDLRGVPARLEEDSSSQCAASKSTPKIIFAISFHCFLALASSGVD